MNDQNKLSAYAPAIVRFAIAGVLIWFGYNQLANPEMWLRVVPEWAVGLIGSAATVVLMNAWFEIVMATLLLAGIQTRVVGLIIAVHIGVIGSTFGFNATAARDYGLAISALSLFFSGSGPLSAAKLFSKKPVAVPNL